MTSSYKKKHLIHEAEPSDAYEVALKKKILYVLYNILYAPLFQEISKEYSKIYNTIDNLINAVLDGQIVYDAGYFKGKFSAGISKYLKSIGGEWDKQKKAFRIEFAKIPMHLMTSISTARARKISLNRALSEAILNIDSDKVLESIDFTNNFYQQIRTIDTRFDIKIPEDLSIAVELSPLEKQMIARDYSNNLKLYIKDFVDKEIPNLRKIVEENVFVGYRATKIKEDIMNRFNISENKANFLAKQETKLLTSQYQILKAKDASIKKYIWRTSKDSHVRHSHKMLDGKVIEIDNPPIVDPETGRRAHAGEDFGCRCSKIWVVE